MGNTTKEYKVKLIDKKNIPFFINVTGRNKIEALSKVKKTYNYNSIKDFKLFRTWKHI